MRQASVHKSPVCNSVYGTMTAAGENVKWRRWCMAGSAGKVTLRRVRVSGGGA